MKTAIFIHAHEKDKVLFFSSISKFLETKGYKTFHLVFSRYELKIYDECRVDNLIFMPKVLKSYSANLSDIDREHYNIEKILYYNLKLNEMNNYKIDKNEMSQNIKRFINFLNEIQSKQMIDLIISWNITFMFDSATKVFADRNEIPHLMFEAGIFRPHTFTIDFKGINYGNSVPQNKEFYLDWAENNLLVDDLAAKICNEDIFPFNPPKLKRLYLYSRLKDTLYRKYLKVDLNLEIIHETLLQKVKKNIRKYVNSRRNKPRNIKLPEHYIFIPFQVHDDSQILINSNEIDSMSSLVALMDKEIRKLNNKSKIKYYCVFKEHPADNGRVDYTDLYKKYKDNEYLIFLKEYDTNELIKNSKLVITINSTVGIQALENYKKVISLGNAYYNIEGIVWNCKNKGELHNIIEKVLREDNNYRLIKSFLNYLRFEYQIEGEWRRGLFNKNKFENKLVEYIKN